MQPIFMAVPSPRLGSECILYLLWVVGVFPFRHIGENQWGGVERNRMGENLNRFRRTLKLAERRSGLGRRCLLWVGVFGGSGSPAILPFSDFLFWDSRFPFFHETGWSSVPPCRKVSRGAFDGLFNHD